MSSKSSWLVSSESSWLMSFIRDNRVLNGIQSSWLVSWGDCDPHLSPISLNMQHACVTWLTHTWRDSLVGTVCRVFKSSWLVSSIVCDSCLSYVRVRGCFLSYMRVRSSKSSWLISSYSLWLLFFPMWYDPLTGDLNSLWLVSFICESSWLIFFIHESPCIRKWTCVFEEFVTNVFHMREFVTHVFHMSVVLFESGLVSSKSLWPMSFKCESSWLIFFMWEWCIRSGLVSSKSLRHMSFIYESSWILPFILEYLYSRVDWCLQRVDDSCVRVLGPCLSYMRVRVFESRLVSSMSSWLMSSKTVWLLFFAM